MAARRQVRGCDSLSKRKEEGTSQGHMNGKECSDQRLQRAAVGSIEWKMPLEWWFRTQASEPVVLEFTSWVCHFLAV